MRRVAIVALTYLAGFAALYLASGFISMSWDVTHWERGSRAGLVLAPAIPTWFVAMCLFL